MRITTTAAASASIIPVSTSAKMIKAPTKSTHGGRMRHTIVFVSAPS